MSERSERQAQVEQRAWFQSVNQSWEELLRSLPTIEPSEGERVLATNLGPDLSAWRAVDSSLFIFPTWSMDSQQPEASDFYRRAVWLVRGAL